MPLACPCLQAQRGHTAGQGLSCQSTPALDKDNRGEAGSGKSAALKTPAAAVPGSAAGLGLFSPLPRHTGTALAAEGEVTEGHFLTNKSLQEHLLYLNEQEHDSSFRQSVGQVKGVDKEFNMG